MTLKVYSWSVFDFIEVSTTYLSECAALGFKSAGCLFERFIFPENINLTGVRNLYDAAINMPLNILKRLESNLDSMSLQQIGFLLIFFSTMVIILFGLMIWSFKLLRLYRNKSLQLKTIFDHTSSGILFLSLDLKIIKLNSLASLFLQRSNVGDKGFDLNQVLSYVCTKDQLEDLKEGKEIHLQLANGTGIPYFYSLKMSSILVKREKYFIVFINDLTKSKMIQNEKEELDGFFQKIYHSAGIGLFEMEIDSDRNVRVVQYSEFFKTLFYPENGQYYKLDQWKEFISKEDLDSFLESMIENAGSDKFIESIFKVNRPRGESIWLKLTAKSKRNQNGVLLVMGITDNVTDLKKTNDVLVLNLKKERELNEMKSQFISIASHEFKNPLSAALSSVEILSHYIDNEVSLLFKEKASNHIEKIKRNIDRINQIMEDVLLIEKNNQGKLSVIPQEFWVNDYFEELVNNFCDNLGVEGTVILQKLKEDIKIVSDKNLLYHIVTNLLSNALKYSLPGSRPPVISLQLISDNKLLFSIKDYGIGIPEQDHSKLFGGFFRSNNAKGIKGTGLGLKIVKDFLYVLKGDVFFDSKEGEGTTFWVKLPIEIVSLESTENALSKDF